MADDHLSVKLWLISHFLITAAQGDNDNNFAIFGLCLSPFLVLFLCFYVFLINGHLKSAEIKTAENFGILCEAKKKAKIYTYRNDPLQ